MDPVIIPELSDRSSSFDSSGSEFLDLIVAAAAQQAEPSRHRYLPRNRERALENLMLDYFVEEPKFTDEMFRTRFRMDKRLFIKIVDIAASFEGFQEGVDARGKPSFTPLQKCVFAIKHLATGNIPNSYDEYLCMSERTSRECLEYFCNAIVLLYGQEFLRRPTSHDVQQLYAAYGLHHGFPKMLGCIDCIHWIWRNCPTRWRGQFYLGDHEYPSLILENVASQDTWFWHALFGVAGSNNDINVLNQSSLFSPNDVWNCTYVSVLG